MQPCDQEQNIRDIQDRLHKGDLFHQEIKVILDTITKNQVAHQVGLDKLNNRLYVDNGTKSIQTIQDRHGRILQVLVWFTGIITAGLVVQAVNAIIHTLI